MPVSSENASSVYGIEPQEVWTVEGWLRQVEPLPAIRSVALVVAFLSCGFRAQHTWVNGHVLMLLAAGTACCVFPNTLLECTVTGPIDDLKLLSTQKIGVMMFGFVLIMILNRKTRDDNFWFSVYTASSLSFCALFVVQWMAHVNYLNTNPGFTNQHLSFSALVSVIFVLGNGHQALRFRSWGEPARSSGRIDEHLLADLVMNVVIMYLFFGYPQKVTAVWNLEGAAIDPIDVYHVRCMGALTLLYVVLDMTALSFMGYKAKQSILYVKCMMMFAVGSLTLYNHFYWDVLPSSAVFQAIAIYVVMGTNAGLGYSCDQKV